MDLDDERRYVGAGACTVERCHRAGVEYMNLSETLHQPVCAHHMQEWRCSAAHEALRKAQPVLNSDYVRAWLRWVKAHGSEGVDLQ